MSLPVNKVCKISTCSGNVATIADRFWFPEDSMSRYFNYCDSWHEHIDINGVLLPCGAWIEWGYHPHYILTRLCSPGTKTLHD